MTPELDVDDEGPVRLYSDEEIAEFLEADKLPPGFWDRLNGGRSDPERPGTIDD